MPRDWAVALPNRTDSALIFVPINDGSSSRILSLLGLENAKNAVRDMVDWLVSDQQLSLHEAYVLCSVAGDLKIRATVDLPNWVVSMTLPRGIFT